MKKQRRVLRAWVKWVPVVAIPFSILFFHTWLNIQILRADYVLRELDGEAREWADRLNHTGVAETIREDPAMLAEQAEQLAFVQPSPGQREVIYYDPAVPLVAPEDENFAVAQLEEGRQAPAEESEARADQSPAVPVPAADTAIPAPSAAPVVEVPADSPAMDQVPVAVPIPAVQPATPEATTPAASDAAVDGVVLEVPEAPMVEEVVDLESAMESLESL
jgi:hypothetical protein